MGRASAALCAPIIVLFGSFAQAADHPAISALPVLGHIDRPGATRIVVRGKLPEATARKMVRLAEGVAADVKRRFLSDADKSDLPPVNLCLFARNKAYGDFVAAVYPEDDVAKRTDSTHFNPQANLGKH